jgi:hypothetical protein
MLRIYFPADTRSALRIRLEMTCGTAWAKKPSRSSDSPAPASNTAWLEVIAVEVRLEEPVSARDAQQRTAPDPDFPHEIDGDLAD